MFKKVTLVIELLKYELKFTLKSTDKAKTPLAQSDGFLR